MQPPKQNPNQKIRSKGKMLPYGRQSIHTSDIDAVIDVLKGDWLTTGPAIKTFEDALCNTTHAKYSVACSSGTAALHLSMMAANIGPGDNVIVPANTFLATANVVRLMGAEVIFADVDPDSGLMLAQHAEEAVARTEARTIKAIIPVYFAGQCSYPAHLRELADTHDSLVIADACHALGTVYDVEKMAHCVGSNAHSDLTTFSFHPVKTITTGEGGAITTEDPDLEKRLRLLCNHGIIRDPEEFQHHTLAHASDGSINPWYYELSQPGLNYRISDLHCALGASQLSRLPDIVRHRRALVSHYRSRLNQTGPLIRPLTAAENCDAAWHLQVVAIDFKTAGITRLNLMSYLKENGIGSQVHYIPVPWQPYYKKRYGTAHLPGAESYYNSCLSLPLFESMTMGDVDRIVDILTDFIN
jgi:UDP-4-amino-4,6-dideoxy-N-acetyl-beta-L-altrosamine transaminase